MSKSGILTGGILIFIFLASFMAKPVNVTAVDQNDIFGFCKNQNISVNNCTVKFKSSMTVFGFIQGSGVVYKDNLKGLRGEVAEKKQICGLREINCSFQVSNVTEWSDFRTGQPRALILRNGEKVIEK